MKTTQTQKPVRVPGSMGCSQLAQRSLLGQPWTELALPCLTSASRVNLGRLRGKPSVINLWASWCGPCRKEMPALQAAHQEYGKTLQFIGVDTKDGATPAANFLREVGVTYPQLFDADALLLSQERIPGLPVTLLIDAKGKLVDRYIGALDAATLKAFVAPVLRTS